MNNPFFLIGQFPKWKCACFHKKYRLVSLCTPQQNITMGCQTSSQYCQEKCNAIVWSRWGQSTRVSGQFGTWAISAITGSQCTVTNYPRPCLCSCSGIKLTQGGSTITPTWGWVSFSMYERPTFALKSDGCVTPKTPGYMYSQYVARAEDDGAASGSCKLQQHIIYFLGLIYFFDGSCDPARSSCGSDPGSNPFAGTSRHRWFPPLQAYEALAHHWHRIASS